MATAYYLKHEGQETGPLGFRDLVALVRARRLVDSDLVRYSWTNEWKRADTLVGLFYMAKKSPETPAQVGALLVPHVTIETVIQAKSAGKVPDSDVDYLPGRIVRLPLSDRRSNTAALAIFGSQVVELPPAACEARAESTNPLDALGQTPGFKSESVGSAEPGSLANGNRWSSIVEEVLASVRSRRSGRRGKLPTGYVQGLFSRLQKVVHGNGQSRPWMRIGYRVICAIAFAAVVAVSVESWSNEEGRRLLRGDSQSATVRLFPVIGKCGTGQYMLLMVDLVLATGAITWLAAGWFESHAE